MRCAAFKVKNLVRLDLKDQKYERNNLQITFSLKNLTPCTSKSFKLQFNQNNLLK